MESTSKAAAVSGSGSSKPKKRTSTIESITSARPGGTAVKKARKKDIVEPTNKEPVNPLLVELVVQEVMGYLDVKSLLQSRQVCKLWDVQAQKALQDKCYTVKFGTSSDISRFVKVTKNLNRLPFEKFSIHDKFTPRIRTYFVNFGAQIKTLNIRINKLPPKTKGLINLNNIHSILNTTPNLENLTLEEIDIFGVPFLVGSNVTLPNLRKIQIRSHFEHSRKRFHADGGLEKRIKAALTRFLRIAPNLETLAVAVPPFSAEPRIALNAFAIFFQVIRLLPTLKHLNIEDTLEQPELKLLLNPEFKLESLKIRELLPDSNTNPVIPAILGNHANTIQTLTMNLKIKPINYYTLPPLPPVALPTLPNLKYLIWDSQNELSFGSLRQAFPKLTRLDLIDVSSLCMTNVFTELTFVEHLTIRSLPKSQMRIENINSTITGLPDPRHTVSAMETFRTLGASEADISRYEGLKLLSAEPSLRDMTNLKTLEISVDPRRYDRVDDYAAYFTLVRMHPLEKLIITNGKLSASYIHKLQKRHRCVVLI